MPPSNSDPVCPKCGGASDFVEKNTFTGEEVREYRCQACGFLFADFRGPALWQVLHDYNQAQAEAERLRAKKAWWKFWKK